MLSKYAHSTAKKVMSYANRYSDLVNSPAQIGALAPSIQSDVIKALIIVAKYSGFYEQFKAQLKAYGVKLRKPDALSAFVRIYTNKASDLGAWLLKVKPILSPSENMLLRFLRLTGLRTGEGIASFNLIISLTKQNKLDDYFNSQLGIMEHFRFKAQFIRGTKNAYISIVPLTLIDEVSKGSPVSYTALVKKLQRRGVECRINQLRDAYGTFLISHGVIREEVDLLQGRVSASIFTRHYFSPAISELRNRTLNALAAMDLASSG